MEPIKTTNELAAACERLAKHPFVTVDTEFLRETTYYPLLCVAQMASPDEAVVVDALAPGHRPQAVLRPDGRTSACSRCSTPRARTSKSSGTAPRPSRIRCSTPRSPPWCSATAIRSPTTSWCSASPATLLDKSNRFTDWTRRPLTEAQLTYAVSDVTHLREVYLSLVADLGRRGRADWMDDEMEVLTSPDTYRAEPEQAWLRLKTRARKPKELAVLIEVAAWREREAQTRDVPRSRVLKDETIGDIAVQAPTTPERLAGLRSLPKGFERSKWGEGILEAVRRGIERDPKTLPRFERPKSAPNGAATVELLKVLLRMTSENHGVAAKVIATVDDLERIAGDDDADVAALKGWRRELFGERALALKHGRLALSIQRGRVVTTEPARLIRTTGTANSTAPNGPVG